MSYDRAYEQTHRQYNFIYIYLIYRDMFRLEHSLCSPGYP